MSRLKLVGKTAENSPYLFELLETDRRAAIARGLKAGTFAPAAGVTNDGRVAMHYIEETNIGNRQPSLAGTASAAAQPISGVASSTFPGGSLYTYVDISIAAVNGTPVAPLVFEEEFESPDGNTGANVTIATNGTTGASSFTRYTFESNKFEDTPDGFVISYTHTEVGSNAPQTPAALPQLGVPAVADPSDRFPVGALDGLISVCMDRSWTSDCDYIVNTGSSSDHRVKLPLKGSVALITPHVFDRTKIDDMRTKLDANIALPPGVDPGLVKLVMRNVGGGCDVDANGAVFAGMSGFWHFATLSSDNKTLSWDVTGGNAIFFDEGCSLIQHDVKLTMRIPAPVLSVPDNTQFSVAFTISNDPDTLRADVKLKPTTITNSCLAEGTQIELSTGVLAPIESLTIGQSVFNPYAGNTHSLTIEDTAKGVESSPMVRIRDDAGRTLLMTEMHPIATPDRGMVQARLLKTGDSVMTTQGASKLVDVGREPYSGKVYNLKVGSKTEQASLGQDQTVVRANGFIVGDGQIQSKYEELAMKQGRRTSLADVPEQWRRDYLMSAARK